MEGTEATGLRAVFPALTRRSLFHHYIPMSGALCHTGVGCHILNPTALPRVIPEYDLAVANLAIINANVGLGVWLYNRHHMRKVSKRTRLMYAVYGASLLNFGSILLWALVKGVLPKNGAIRALFGSLTSLCLLAIGKEYMSYIDFLVADVNEPAQ